MTLPELRAVAEFLEDCARRGRPAATATLVRLEGSGYRRPGARMAVAADGVRGFVSGGCVEADLAERAPAVIRAGAAQLVSYDLRGRAEDVWGLAAGCNGRLDVLLEPAPERDSPAHPAQLLRHLEARRPAVLATVFRSCVPGIPAGARFWFGAGGEIEGPRPAESWVGEALGLESRAALAAGRARSARLSDADSEIDVLVEPLVPAVRVLIVGAGPDAVPLTELAVALGWEVVVVDARPALADPARFPTAGAVVACEPERLADRLTLDPRSAAIVMTHRFDDDVRWLRALMPSAAGYVGLLGPAVRRDAVLAALGCDRARLRAPAGLDLGGTTPEEIALAMLAEICATLAGRGGGPLRDRAAPLHDRDGAP